MTSPAIFNPNIPCSYSIPGGLTPRKMIFIKGHIPHGANRWSFNLQSGPNPEADVAFHFNPRFEGTNQVVRNHRQSNNWGQEERHGGYPFNQNSDFECIILVEQDCYKVAVNGKHFIEFKHRMPKERASYIRIEGAVQIKSISFQGDSVPFMPPSGGCGTNMGGYGPPHGGYAPPPGGYAPPPGGYAPPPGGYGPSGGYVPPPEYNPSGAFPGSGYPPQPGNFPGAYPGSGYPSQPVYNPSIPHTQNIPGGMYPGRKIYISGVPNMNPSRFHINLVVSHGSRDIGLHFDVRFNYGGTYNVVVRNSQLNGGWQNEDRSQPYFPFAAGANFDLIILCEPNCYKVAVNNQHFIEFGHRLQSTSVDTLEIGGDVRINSVTVQ